VCLLALLTWSGRDQANGACCVRERIEVGTVHACGLLLLLCCDMGLELCCYIRTKLLLLLGMVHALRG
jgi:hypothetical protein